MTIKRRPPVFRFAGPMLAGTVLGCAAVAAGSADPATVHSSPSTAAGTLSSSDEAVAASRMADSAEALFRIGELGAAAEVFLNLPSEWETGRVVERLETLVARLNRHEIEGLAEMAGDGTNDPRFGPVFAELALSYALIGETAQARGFALRARGAGASGRAGRVTAAVLDGDVSDLVPADPLVGAVLPVSGSPSNREYTRLFMEGVEVAAGLARQAGVHVEFVVEDNRGTASGSVRGVSALAARGAVAILGPLNTDNMYAAIRAAPNGMALFSPTARSLPGGRRGVYSLGAGDPGAGRTLAEAVVGLGYTDAVVIHPRSPGETLEAAAFDEVFAASGGVVRRTIQYAPGTTTFEGPLLAVDSLLPELLVVAAPAGDVELLAPQFAFFGLDTLGIQVAGTAAWTVPSVIEAVAQRHTDWVIAVSTVPPDSVRDPGAEFVEAYESHFRRTLHSLIPAVGFDLFRMALGAYGESARASVDPVTAFERLHRFEGVTGTYSFAGGRLTRDFFPVWIFEGALHPVDADFLVLPPPERGSSPANVRPRAP